MKHLFGAQRAINVFVTSLLPVNRPEDAWPMYASCHSVLLEVQFAFPEDLLRSICTRPASSLL